MTLSRPRGWSDLSRVERVDLYTRLSLHLILWGFCGVAVLAILPDSMRSVPAAAVVGGGGVVVTGLGSLVLASVIEIRPAAGPLPWSRLAVLIAASGGYLALAGVTGDDAVRRAVATVVVANLCVSLGGLPDNRVTAGLLVVSGLIFGIDGADVRTVLTGVVAGAIVAASLILSVRVSLWLLGVVTELDAARLAQAQLAVAEERLRFSRDVHDVLGRRLSAIAVQSELAASLAERGDDRAAERMLQVRSIAHEALAEARELARGYRPTDLAHELDGARSLLRSAGIEVELSVDVVPRAWHEAAGWVVRESVTNVLRHSDAHLVRISFDDGRLQVDNDGVSAHADADGATGASGLRGLQERLEPLGARLLARRAGEGWSVEAHLPGSGPISASTSVGSVHPVGSDDRAGGTAP